MESSPKTVPSTRYTVEDESTESVSTSKELAKNTELPPEISTASAPEMLPMNTPLYAAPSAPNATLLCPLTDAPPAPPPYTVPAKLDEPENTTSASPPTTEPAP